MNASDYLRVRFQNDRQLSIYIENGFTNTMYTVPVASAMAEAIAQSAFLSKAVARKLAGKMPVGVYSAGLWVSAKNSYGSPGTESNRSKLLLDSLPSKAGDALLLR